MVFTEKHHEVQQSIEAAVETAKKNVEQFYENFQRKFQYIVPYLPTEEIRKLDDAYHSIVSSNKGDVFEQLFNMKKLLPSAPSDKLSAFTESIDIALKDQVYSLYFVRIELLIVFFVVIPV